MRSPESVLAGSRGRRRVFLVRRIFIVVFTLAFVFLLVLAAGCGSSGPSPEEVTEQRHLLSTALAEEIYKRDQIAAQKAAQERARRCRAAISSFLDAVQEVDSRLDVGLSYDEYSDAVGDASVERGRARDVGSFGRRCQRAFTAAEEAFHKYRSGASTWNDCISDVSVSIYFDTSCTFDDIDPEMQEYWADAHSLIETAFQRLRSVAGNPSTPRRPSHLLPRSASEVEQTVYGVTARQLCSSSAPVVAEEPCDSLVGLLAGGVDEDEEVELNDVLLGITEAYGLTPAALRPEDRS